MFAADVLNKATEVRWLPMDASPVDFRDCWIDDPEWPSNRDEGKWAGFPAVAASFTDIRGQARLFVRGDDLAIHNLNVGDVVGQLELFAIFGRIE